MDFVRLIVLIFICTGIGFLLSTILQTLREEGKKKGPAGSETTDGILLRRNPQNGLLIVEMEGQAIQNAIQLNDIQRNALHNLLLDLQTWLGLPTQTVREEKPAAPQPVRQPPPIEQSSPARPMSEPRPTPPSAEVDSLFPQPAEPAKIAKPSINPINLWQRALDPTLRKTPAAQKSIVEQVNDILQEKLEGTPLSSRGIKLAENFDHSMQVVVGINRYDGVDAVPDEEVKQLIRQCVAEWSSRASGK